MNYEEDQKLILNTEKKISYEEGIEESKIKIAKNLLSLNLSLGDIQR